MRICVIGLGRLGLPWALVADAAGHDVRGLDIDAQRVTAINERRVNTREPGLSALLSDPRCRLTASTDPTEALAQAELSIVTVSTATNIDGGFGLEAVLAAMRAIGTNAHLLAAPHVVVLKSTVSPGTTEGRVRAELTRADGASASPRTVGLVHAPEFHAIGSIVHDITHPYQVILGGTEQWALALARDLHVSLLAHEAPVVELDTTGAELAKLASNSFRTLKIAFANATAELCTAYGSDPHAVCAAIAADPHIGRGYFRPGLPYGGPCYPRDNPALRAAAAAAGVPTPLPAAIEAANERRFAELERQALEAAPGAIGVVGVGFRAGSDELEGSPALELVDRLRAAGREVLIHDPLVEPPQPYTQVPLETVLDSCPVVILAAADERLAAQLQAELGRRARPPHLIDPGAALARPPRGCAERPPRASPAKGGQASP